MQTEFINELTKSINAQLLGLIFQLVFSGLVLMSIKDFSLKILDYIKLRFSDFGRGTEIIINKNSGYIMNIGFNEVEIYLNEDSTLFMPLANFIKSDKIIVRRVRYNKD